jgi:1,3-beta-glucan synthase
VTFFGTLNSTLPICQYTNAGQIIGGQAGCYNLVPVFDWIQRCIISILLVFMIAFLPLFLQGERLLVYLGVFIDACCRAG